MAEFLLLVIVLVLVVWIGQMSRQLRELSDRVGGLEQERRPPAARQPPAPTPSRSTTLEVPSVAASPRPAAVDLPSPTTVSAPMFASSGTSATLPQRNLEVEIGSRWALVTGVFVLVLGVAFFVKYSFDRHWINETARVSAGTVA